MTDLVNAMNVSTSALKAQSARMRVISENIANANSTGTTPGSEPYQRQTISFKDVFDPSLGTHVVDINKYGVDPSPFKKRYEPAHPAADAQGYVLLPNVKTSMELMDMREAQRSYEASVTSIESSRNLLIRTLDLLR